MFAQFLFLSKMNITLFYSSNWIICSIWERGCTVGGVRGSQATVRRAASQVQALLEKYHVAAIYDPFNTRESWTQSFPPRRMIRRECDRVNTAVKKNGWRRKSGYTSRRRDPCLSAVNYADVCLTGSTHGRFYSNFPLFKWETLLWLCSCAKGKPWWKLFTGRPVLKFETATVNHLHRNSQPCSEVEVSKFHLY